MPGFYEVYEDLGFGGAEVLGLDFVDSPQAISSVSAGRLNGALSLNLTDTAIDSAAPGRWRPNNPGRVEHVAEFHIARRVKPDEHNVTFRRILEDEVALIKTMCNPSGQFARKYNIRFGDVSRELSPSHEWMTSVVRFDVSHYLEME